jgi:hypothetical protein
MSYPVLWRSCAECFSLGRLFLIAVVFAADSFAGTSTFFAAMVFASGVASVARAIRNLLRSFASAIHAGARPRIRFTQARELGHYILPRKTRTSVECTTDDMDDWQAYDRAIEIEADRFAANL